MARASRSAPICSGAVYRDRLKAEPGTSLPRWPDCTRERMLQSGNYLNALFHYKSFVPQGQKLRLLTRYVEQEGRRPPTPAQERAPKPIKEVMFRIGGRLEMAEFLRTQFLGSQRC